MQWFVFDLVSSAAVCLSVLFLHVSLNLQFSALTVPEPVDTQSAKIDAQEQEAVSVFITQKSHCDHLLVSHEL